MSLLKKALIFLPFTLAAAPAAAQYPQLNKVAKAKIDSMEQAWAKHQAEVWAKCEPIVKKEHAEGRPYVPWAGRRQTFHRQRFRRSRVLKAAVCTASAAVAARSMS